MWPLPVALLPAASVLVMLTFLRPSAPRLKVPEVGVVAPVSRLQWPALSALTWKVAPPTVTETVLPASAVPVSTGVVSPVVCGLTVGAVGAVVSTVRLSGWLGWLSLPAASVRL